MDGTATGSLVPATIAEVNLRALVLGRGAVSSEEVGP